MTGGNDRARWDVVVVGLGDAGATAAIEAHDRGARVLVVEDEQLTAETYVAHLDRLPGFEVAAVAGSLLAARQVAAAGLHADGRFPFDVVLLDMNLPDRHGLVLCRQLRAAGLVVDVIAVTAAREVWPAGRIEGTEGARLIAVNDALGTARRLLEAGGR